MKLKTKSLEIFTVFFFLPLVFTFGFILDLIESLLLKGKGGGKWFWFFSSAIVGIYLCKFKQVDYIFTTGGPASAHLTGVITKFFFKKKLFVELQDPLVGKDIGRSSLSSKYLSIFEKIILRNCDKLIFVTNSAAKECKLRNLNFKFKIKSVYSGAVKLIKCNKKFYKTIEVYSLRHFIYFKEFKKSHTSNKFIK